MRFSIHALSRTVTTIWFLAYIFKRFYASFHTFFIHAPLHTVFNLCSLSFIKRPQKNNTILIFVVKGLVKILKLYHNVLSATYPM